MTSRIVNISKNGQKTVKSLSNAPPHIENYSWCYEKNGDYYIYYLFGGQNYEMKRTYNGVFSFDTQALSFTCLKRDSGNIPFRGNCSMIKRNDCLVLFGGIKGNGRATSEMVNFSIDDQNFNVKTESVSARYRHTALYSSKRDCMYVFGGKKTNPTRSSRSLYCYDFVYKQWTKIRPRESKPGKRFNHSMNWVTDDEKSFVVIGGYDGSNFYSDSWIYHIEEKKWEKINTTGAVAKQRSSHGAFSNNGKIFVFGGFPGSSMQMLDLKDYPSEAVWHEIKYNQIISRCWGNSIGFFSKKKKDRLFSFGRKIISSFRPKLKNKGRVS